MKKDLTVLILTFNEEKHIERCIKSLQEFAKEIFIVDSFSTDNTVNIAKELGAKVYCNKWKNYATQFNWGLENCPIETEWVMRMDADEYIMPELSNEIISKLDNVDDDTTGIYIKRRVFFLNQWIKYGGFYPTWLLRIWRHKKGYCEQRWHDEHIQVSEGNTIEFNYDLVDDNMSNLTWWTEKHNRYATIEAVDILNHRFGFIEYDEMTPAFFGTQAQRKRWLKHRYMMLPLFIRPFLYFHYRYIFQVGFLDGKKGLIFHFLQAFWYRFYVDVKVYEIYHHAGKDKDSILKYLKDTHNIVLD